MCSVPIVWWPSASASRSDMSSTFLACGAYGMFTGGVHRPWPMISSTCSRTAARLIPSDSSVSAATPSSTWMRPSRMCSVPMRLCLSILASS
jgi:hypothetical protein